MDVTQSHTESLRDLVKAIDQGVIMLPEFQRDFRWEIEQTLILFDSLVRDIFIGTIIYGKPSFGMTLRALDTRPRKGPGSRAKVATKHYNDQEIKTASQVKNLRIVLDGQQRLTSIYRALKGMDEVFFVVDDFSTAEEVETKELDEIITSFEAEENTEAVSVRLSDVYNARIIGTYNDEKVYGLFEETLLGRRIKSENTAQFKELKEIYRIAMHKLSDLFKAEKMVAYYLLDMSLSKFCLFFERSNSRGILLNFTDILAAKLYHGFNLRQRIEDYESQNGRINRELVIRAIAYIKGSEQENRSISIDRQTILTDLTAEDFITHWDSVCKLYTECMNYLQRQHYIVSPAWIPSENLLLPLMMMRRSVKGFDQLSEVQRAFLQFWFWASIFSNRYSGSSNEVIIQDSKLLEQVARNEKIPHRTCARMRSRVDAPEDLFSFTKRSAIIYRGVLNLIGFAHQGLKDWNNTQKLGSKEIEGHHIYPQAYIRKAGASLDVPPHEAEELVDSVVNITLIPKLTNIKIGARSPSEYLGEVYKLNPELDVCLREHFIDPALRTEPSSNTRFLEFLKLRADAMWKLITQFTNDQIEMMELAHEVKSERNPEAEETSGLPRMPELIARGLLKPGDLLFVQGHDAKTACLVDENRVEFSGDIIPINTWAQRVTGWRSVNIYREVALVKTGQSLDWLRGHALTVRVPNEMPPPVPPKRKRKS